MKLSFIEKWAGKAVRGIIVKTLSQTGSTFRTALASSFWELYDVAAKDGDMLAMLLLDYVFEMIDAVIAKSVLNKIT